MKNDAIEANKSNDTGGEEKATMLSLLQRTYTFAKDLKGQTWAVRKDDWPVVISASEGKFERWLWRDFIPVQKEHQLHPASPADKAAALDEVLGKVRRDGPVKQVHIRTALSATESGDPQYIIDLGEGGFAYVSAESKGIVSKEAMGDHWFHRPSGFGSIPADFEQSDKSFVELIKDIFSLEDSQSLILVIAWLVEALRPDTPYPILMLKGPPGSAKSTTQRLLKQLIDPSSSNLTISPRREAELKELCECQLVVSLDNCDGLSTDLQNLLCGVATGTGMLTAPRSQDRAIQAIKNPVIINGLADLGSRLDFLERTLIIQTVKPSPQKNIQEVIQSFEDNKSVIFAGLLELMSNALKILPTTEIPDGVHPRFIEFYCLGLAIEKVLNQKGGFAKAFEANHKAILDFCISSNIVIATIISYFEGEEPKDPLTGTAMSLLEKIFSSSDTKMRIDPASAKSFASTLDKYKELLLELGIDCKREEKRSNRGTVWKISRVGTNPSTEVAIQNP